MSATISCALGCGRQLRGNAAEALPLNAVWTCGECQPYDVEAGVRKLAEVAAENALAALLRGSRDLAIMAANAIRCSPLLERYKPLLPGLERYAERVGNVLPDESA